MVRLKVVYQHRLYLEKTFQFLMVRLKVFSEISYDDDILKFQFLMVRLKDMPLQFFVSFSSKFQFLMVRLKVM